jgi:uncharacterized membrane protein YjjB (DUF3815 family)
VTPYTIAYAAVQVGVFLLMFTLLICSVTLGVLLHVLEGYLGERPQRFRVPAILPQHPGPL